MGLGTVKVSCGHGSPRDSGSGSPENQRGLARDSEGCRVPASLSSLPPAGSLAEMQCSPSTGVCDPARAPRGYLLPAPGLAPPLEWSRDPLASLTRSQPHPLGSSPAAALRPPSSAPKAEVRAGARAPRAHARGRLRGLPSATPGPELAGGQRSSAHFRDAPDPVRAPRRLLPSAGLGGFWTNRAARESSPSPPGGTLEEGVT